MQKNLKISVFGKNYLISTDEESSNILEAARIVDDLMRDKAERAPVHGEGQLAVLVALEIATDLVKKQQELSHWEDKVVALTRAIEAV